MQIFKYQKLTAKTTQMLHKNKAWFKKGLVLGCVGAKADGLPAAAPMRNGPVCRRMRKVMSKVPTPLLILLPSYCSSNASRLPKNEEARKWSNGLDHLISSPCKYFNATFWPLKTFSNRSSWIVEVSKMVFLFRNLLLGFFGLILGFFGMVIRWISKLMKSYKIYVFRLYETIHTLDNTVQIKIARQILFRCKSKVKSGIHTPPPKKRMIFC